MASSIQVHKIHVTVQGIQPDPLVISANDCVSWVWLDGESFTVQEILQPDHNLGKPVVHLSQDVCKRYAMCNKEAYMYVYISITVTVIYKDLNVLIFLVKRCLDYVNSNCMDVLFLVLDVILKYFPNLECTIFYAQHNLKIKARFALHCAILLPITFALIILVLLNVIFNINSKCP